MLLFLLSSENISSDSISHPVQSSTSIYSTDGEMWQISDVTLKEAVCLKRKTAAYLVQNECLGEVGVAPQLLV